MELSNHLDTEKTFGWHALSSIGQLLTKTSSRVGRGWFSRWLALVCRKLVLSYVTDPIIDASVAGLKIRFYPFDNITDRVFLFMPQIFDVVERRFMLEVLKSNSIFVDIGGNSGMYALLASQIITKGHIITFEPHPIMVQRLAFNVRLNDLGGIIRVKPYGIADTQKYFELAIQPKDHGSNSMILEKNQSLETIHVPCKTLVEVLVEEKIKRIDLLKIDIEKVEHLALNPFFETAPKNLYPRHIIIETDDQVNLRKYGYTKLTRTKNHNSIYSHDPKKKTNFN